MNQAAAADQSIAEQSIAAGAALTLPHLMQTPIQTVAVIGAGTAGRSFALAAACAGFHVILEDVMPANLRKAEADFAEMFPTTAKGGKLSLANTVEGAVRDADLAIDFVPDELESKLEIFSMIDRMAPPRTILCTPSDALSITDLASCIYRPDRAFAVRGPLLPDPAAPLQLLYPAAASPARQAALLSFLQALGHTVQVQPDPDAPMLVKNLIPAALEPMQNES